MTECKEIERKAYQHLMNCAIDDIIIWANEVGTVFEEFAEQFKKLGELE